jgi:exosortase K
MLTKTQNTIFLAFVGLIVIAIKAFYSVATWWQLRFILAPTNFLVTLFVNQETKLDIDKGYVYPNVGIVIDKFCAGINFWLIAFLTVFFAKQAYYQEFIPKLKLFMVVFVATFFLTIFTNASRIIVAIRLQKLPFEWIQTTWFHEAQGTFMYFTVLLLVYIAVSKRS